MKNFDLLIIVLDIRANRASDALLSQAYDEHPAGKGECQRVHDRLIGAWSECVSASRYFSASELEALNKRQERVTFLAHNLRWLADRD